MFSLNREDNNLKYLLSVVPLQELWICYYRYVAIGATAEETPAKQTEKKSILHAEEKEDLYKYKFLPLGLHSVRRETTRANYNLTC